MPRRAFWPSAAMSWLNQPGPERACVPNSVLVTRDHQPNDDLSNLDVAVIICAYTLERWTDIVAAVESALGQVGVEPEVILVVDHNADLVQRATDHFSDQIRIVENRYKRGLSGARNTGVESSTATILAFLDDDAKADPDWLERLVAPFRDSDVCGTGGRVDPLWEVPRPGWWPPEFDWVVGCSRSDLPTEIRDIRNPVGASMAVRRSAVDQAGGFHYGIGRIGKLPIGCEEVELFIRIRRTIPGARVLQIPESRVLHRVTPARATWKYFRRRCYADGTSKAVVSQLAGVDDGLSEEWKYTLVTIPVGVLRNIAKGIKGERVALLRAGAIVAGLFITTVGYIRGRLSKGPDASLAPVPKSAGKPEDA